MIETNIKSVAVIGCGPSSLAAAWAARGLGASVSIFAPKKKSPLRGPIMLHAPIPGITMDHPDGYVRQTVVGGNYLDYRKKLYGDVNVDINGNIMLNYHAWRMYETYDRLWGIFSDEIQDLRVTRGGLTNIAESFPLVVNTAPATEFCFDDRHSFVYKEVAVINKSSIEFQEDNTVVYNADPGTPWVRSSIIFGNEATEWPVEEAPSNAFVIKKPISTDCSCFPSVFRTGRFGAWKNETWVDTAYYQTREALINA